ncbi:MAG: PorP/SprF family type IX secretion system membrane protein [Chitinophagaceae bacterium]
MVRYIQIVCLLLCLDFVQAQDPHFSQFFASPLTLNPANTGNFSGRLRVAGNYRNQWPDFGNAYITSTIAVDGSLFRKSIPKSDKFSAGLVLLADQTGNGILKENYVLLSAAYTKSLDANGHQSITLGFQGGMGNYLFDADKANFEDEISPSGFTIPTSEILLGRDLNKHFFDVHTGILYKLNVDNDNGIYVGASLYHLAKPNFGFNSNHYTLQHRFNIHGGGFMQLGYLTTLHTSFQYQKQFNYKALVVGAAISRVVVDKMNTSTELYLGAWIRNKDSFIPYLGVEWNNLRAGFSYDYKYSNKNATPLSFQSTEVSLSWILANSIDAAGIKCPKF